MSNLACLKLVTVFAVVFSLAGFLGAPSSTPIFPSIQLGHADPAPCSLPPPPTNPCSENWVPAGPAMDTFVATIFSDATAEYSNLETNPSIDLADSPIPSGLASSFCVNSNFYCTSTIAEHGYFEVEYMLAATNFWNCHMDFGNSACGINIRQGISHLIDKTKFVNSEPSTSAIDNPLPTSNGGLLSPNPCLWDNAAVPAALSLTFSTAPVPGTLQENGASCTVGESGATGGLAYHLATATGTAGPSPWQPNPSDLDFCAAAAHFIDAGIATGIVADSANPALRNCELTGVQASVTSNPINFYVRSDDLQRLHLGEGLAQVICALFNGVYSASCGINGSTNNVLIENNCPITCFPGFTTSTDSVNQSWDMYTAEFGNVFPFDNSLYYTYNSRFVSGISQIRGGTPTSPCDLGSVPTLSAANYIYLCSPVYESLSNSMEFANCLSAQRGTDPTAGQTTPTFGTCNAGGNSALSAGYQAEDFFGKNAFTLPVFEQTAQFGYLQCTPTFRPCSSTGSAEWQRVINHFGNGVPNYHTWLDAWNSNPAQTGTLRQGFAQTTRSLSPYIASTQWDGYIVSNIYDSLHVVNPVNNVEDLSWMDISQIPVSSVTYAPPPGTVSTFRFTFMPNLSWQDGRPLTSFDVAYSYLSLLAVGAYQSGGASPLTGVTILSPIQFDLNVRSVGPFTSHFMTGLTIVPGRYWTCGYGAQPSTGTSPNIVPTQCPNAEAGNWDTSVSNCTAAGNTCYPVQYVLGAAPAGTACFPNAAAPCAPPASCLLNGCVQFPASLMNVDIFKTGALYDPIAAHILIGSGPWTCGTGAGIGQACAPGNVMNPGVGQSYTLQRNGKAVFPGMAGDYVRSSGFLATYLWSGDISVGVSNFSASKQCLGVAPVPLSVTPPAPYACAHWQQGIGTNGATTPPGVNGCPGSSPVPCGIPVGPNQISIVKLYINIFWVFPDSWNFAPPPVGIVPLDPVLYEGTGTTLSPASGTGGVGCYPPFPAGGYDC